MKKSRIKSVILAVLLIVVIISLVGCVKLQKKTSDDKKADADKSDDKQADDKKSDKKKNSKKMSSVEDEAKKIEKDVKKVEELTNMTEEADKIEPEPEEDTPEPAADDGLPVKKVTEGELVSFPNLKAVDPDGDSITYKFTSPLDATGRWQTREGDAGEHVVTITASDGKNEVSQQVKIVVEAKNKAPTITLSSPKEINVKEGEKVEIKAEARDPDEDPVTLTFSGWMDKATRTTTYDDAGQHTVTITATDGKKEATEEVTVIVENVNRAPELTEIADLKITEGDEIKVDAEATDPDGDEVTVTFSTPLGAQDGKWTTKQGDAGTYEVEVTAADGEKEAKETFKITVQSLNKAPEISLASTTINVDEGETVMIDAEITDEENDELTITYSGWMTSSTYQTDYDDAGTHTVTITATDSINTVTEEVTVIVADKNRPPTFDPGAFS
ncbi:hypothetical protein GF343_03060 [Candidatus Woesearchaeota archaeon]|nr:hypothetical protein [Candidatus Woesearchaeota archaeon]